MTIKWSKALCVEYSQQMKSKLEEIARQAQGNGQRPLEQSLLTRIREGISGHKLLR